MADQSSGAVFARRIKTERERMDVSQAVFARMLTDALGENVSPSAVSRIEDGTRSVKIHEAVAIAEVLGVDLASLLTEKSARELKIEALEFELAEARFRAQDLEDQMMRARGEVAELEQAVVEMQREGGLGE